MPRNCECFIKVIHGIVKWIFIIFFVGHLLPFIPFGICVASIFKQERNKKASSGIMVALGPLTIPFGSVYLMNNILEWYVEIQSWQISYICWGICVAIFVVTENIWNLRSELEWETARLEHVNFLFFPFGIKVKTAGMANVYSFSLLALAAAIVGGFIANYMFEIKYYLQCDVKYNNASGFCTKGIMIDGVCCVTLNSHDEWMDFLPELASSCLAAWGLIKVLGTLLVEHDPEVKNVKRESNRESITERDDPDVAEKMKDPDEEKEMKGDEETV